MKRATDVRDEGEDMLEEYDFTNAERGHYRHLIGQPYTTRIHHPDGTVTVEESEPSEGTVFLASDVRAYFPDSEAVNKALRGLIALIPDAPQEAAPDKVR